MKRTLSTVILLFAAITLMAQNSFIVADKNGNSQLVQSLIFQQDANNDRFSWNTNNDANGYQQTRDIKDLLFIARTKKGLSTGSAEEVINALEGLAGTDNADAKAVAVALQSNPNIEEAYSEDGHNVVVKKKGEEGSVIYPMYEMKSPFSELKLPDINEQVRSKQNRIPRKARDYNKVAIFNFFEGMKGYEVQNTLIEGLRREFDINDYDVDLYTPNNQIESLRFTYDNLGSVIYGSSKYAAVIIISHGAKTSEGNNVFSTGEIGKEGDKRLFNPADNKEYKCFSSDLRPEPNCILYLGICDGMSSDKLKSSSPVIGYSGVTCMAQANAAILFAMMLSEDYTLEDAFEILPKNLEPNKGTEILKTDGVGEQRLDGTGSFRTQYDKDASVVLKLNDGYYPQENLWEHVVNGQINGENKKLFVWTRLISVLSWNFFPIKGNNVSRPAKTDENGVFFNYIEINGLPEGIYKYRVEVCPVGKYDPDNREYIKPRKHKIAVCSDYFKNNSAVIVPDKSETTVPIIRDNNSPVEDVILSVGGSQTFKIDGYSGHTFRAVSVKTSIATVSLMGTTLTVDGISEGTTYIGVYDEQNQQTAIAKVIVNRGGETPDASIITFEDPTVKAICVANWDTNGDGELSKDEAAAVTDLGTVFESNQKITSFNELQFFTGLTNIEDSTFFYCRDLTSVTIPNSVTNIGNDTFGYCSSLTSVTIPNSVMSIGSYAFEYCSSLTSITIPNSLTSIGNDTFGYCSSLTSVTIPNSVMSIGSYAFKYCSSLTSITIPNSVTNIGDGAFSSSGLTSITIPTSVTIIGNCAFAYSSLTSLIIPSSVTSIGQQTFEGCRNLASIIVEKGNTVYDSRDNCNAIIHTATNRLITGSKKTVIPNTVKCIGYRAFMNYDGLTSIAIPNSVEEIERDAFYGCKNLTSVTLPNSLIHFWYGIFYYCPLQEIYSYITMPYKVNIFNNSSYGATLYVPKGTKTKYEETEGWNRFKNIVEM